MKKRRLMRVVQSTYKCDSRPSIFSAGYRVEGGGKKSVDKKIARNVSCQGRWTSRESICSGGMCV